MKKKIYLLFSILLLSSMSFAQSVTLWTEHFETDLDNWTSTGTNPFVWNNSSGGMGSPLNGSGGQNVAAKAFCDNAAGTDAWLVSPAQTLTAGVEYTIQFYCKLGSTTNGSLQLYVGTSATDFSSATLLAPDVAPSTSINAVHRAMFTPPTTGTYYIGFNAKTTGSTFIIVDRVSLEKLETPATDPCPAITAPWSESFTGTPFSTNPYLPTECWRNTGLSNAGVASSTNYVWKRYAGTGSNPTCSPQDGDGYMLQYNNYSYTAGSKGYLVLPKIALQSTDLKFTFYVYRNDGSSYASSSYPDRMNVYVSTTESITDAIGSPATVYRNRTLGDVVESADGWYQYAVTIPAEATPVTRYIILEGISGYGHNMYVDNLELSPILATDAGITAITAPVKGVNVNLSSASVVTVKIKNFGTLPITTGVPVKFEVNGTVVGNETYSGTIAPGAEVVYSFTTKADLSAAGDYTIKAYTQLGDGNPSNDAQSIPVTNIVCAGLTTPWSEGFNEASISPCWLNTTTGTAANHFWQVTSWGSGGPKEGTGMLYFNSSGISDRTIKARLTSPEFSTAGTWDFSFWIYRDYAWDTYVDSVNIYLSPTTDITGLAPIFTVYRNIWLASAFAPAEVERDNYISGWYQYRVSLPDIGNAHITIEVANGWGSDVYLDAIAVEPTPPPVADARVTAITAPTAGVHTDLTASETLTIKVRNVGTATLPTIPVRYSVNGEKPVEEVLPGPFAPNAEVTYSFSTPIDLSAEGTYVIKAYTRILEDINTANDTASITINKYVCEVKSLPLTEDFETAVAGELITPCWTSNYAYPYNYVDRNHTPEGEWSWRLNNGGIYLITPELEVTSTSKTIDYWMYVTTVAASWKIGYSTTTNDLSAFDGNYTLVEPTDNEYQNYKGTVPGDAKYIIFYNVDQLMYLDDLTIDFALDVVSTNIDTEAQIVDQDFEITFSKPISPADLSGIKLTLADGTEATIELSYEGNVLTVLHETLAFATTYTLTIPAGTITGYNKELVYTFTTETEAPKVVSTTPAADATNVAIDATVSITFDKAVDTNGAPDFTGISFLALDDFDSEDGYEVSVSGVTFDGNTITIAHEDFPTYKKIKVIVPAGAVAGYDQAITWKFTTAPKLISVTTTDPENGATGVAAPFKIIEINFDAKPDFNAPLTAANFAKFKVKDAAGNYLEGIGVTQKKSTGRPVQTYPIITIDPGQLAYSTTYTVEIEADAFVGFAGAYSFSFTTAAADIEPLEVLATTPEEGETGVALDALVSVTFDKEVVLIESTAQVTIFETADPGSKLTGVNITVDASDSKIITISHGAFRPYHEYTVEIPAGIIQGVDEVISWSFTTAATPIAVSTKTPADNATAVALDAEVKVTFDTNLWANDFPVLSGVTIKDAAGTAVTNVKAATDGLPPFAIKITHDAFAYGTKYTITIPEGAIVGVTGAISWSFTTEEEAIETPLEVISTTPAAGATDVALNAPVSVTFDGDVVLNDAALVAATIFEKAAPDNKLSGVTVAVDASDSKILTIAHDLFKGKTEYTVNIPTGIIQGVEAVISWSFTTTDGVGIRDITTGQVFAANGRLYVNAYPEGSSVAIYNIVGQLVATHRVTSDNLVVDLNPGAYIVNVQSQGKAIIHKVLVK